MLWQPSIRSSDANRSAQESDSSRLVELTGVSLATRERSILEKVDITVYRGEIVTLIGPNGAGKSTLLKVVTGLLKPDAGRVWRRPGLKIGYVPQHLEIDPVMPMTARRFLCLPKTFPEKALRSAMAEVGAPALLDQPLQSLSGGETQRLLLARSLLREPDLLILDEPLQGVDIAGQDDLLRLIEKLRRERACGIVLVSHDLHLVMAGTDRVVCLNRHVCCSGRPDHISRDPRYLALFGPKAADRLAVYHHHHDHRHDLAGEPLEDRREGHDHGAEG